VLFQIGRDRREQSKVAPLPFVRVPGKIPDQGQHPSGPPLGKHHLASESGHPSVNHKVTVTGTVTRDTKGADKKAGEVENAAGKQEYGDLLVSSLTIVSKTCGK
jgi:hypothetical protein